METFHSSSKECSAKYENNLQFSMDYDSGYMSHNPESNLDSSSETYENLLVNLSKPVYLSEDALLEKPPVTKYNNINEDIERENYEDARNLVNLSDNETILSSSVISQESNYCDFDREESASDISVEIPEAKRIIFDDKNNFTGKLDENKQISIPLINITNTLSTNDPRKKLTLIFSKDDKENTYSVKRKYKSLTPNKCEDLENKCKSSSSQEVEREPHCSYIEFSFGESIPSNGNKILEESLSSPNIVCLSHKYNLDKSNIPNAIPGQFLHTINNSDIITSPIEVVENVQEHPSSDKHISINSATSSCNNSTSGHMEKSEIISLASKSSIIDESSRRKCDSELMEVNTSSSVVECLPNCTMTPKKQYCNFIDPNISPDLFAEDQQESTLVKETCLPPDYIVEEQNVVKKDHHLLRRAQNSLKGVLPPHSMTIIQISVNEILNRLEINKDYFWNSHPVVKDDVKKDDSFLNSSSESSAMGESKSLLINTCLEECMKDKWPENLKERNLGLHHNRSKLSEQFEDLCSKFAKRYVGAETQSTCTVFEVNCLSPKKRVGNASKPRWAAKSPGRRLSHLARRRITFSSANLQTGSSLAIPGNRARQILVDAKKLDLLNRRRSPRKTPRKTPNKSPRKKARTPSSSAKKKLAVRFRKLTGEIEGTNGLLTSSENKTLNSKRALFQSPDKNKESVLFLPSTFGLSTFENDSKKPAKRALFMSPSKNSPLKNKSFTKSPFKRLELGLEKKRKRESQDVFDPPLKIARSMSLDVKTMEKTAATSLSRTKSESVMTTSKLLPPTEMSAVNKKKLQWAVYEALRSQNVTPVHAQFKVFASNLARVVRKLFYQLGSVTGSNSTAFGSGTTERMLRLARKHASAVVNGLTVEEVLNEYTKMKSKQQKPQGYITIEDFKASREKRNILLDKTRAMDNLENKKVVEPSKPKVGSDNRIDRIRKVINFGDDYNR